MVGGRGRAAPLDDDLRPLRRLTEPIEGIALWLGHESPTTTHQYVEADLAMKEKALAKLQDPDTAARRFKATDSLLEFLKTP